MMWCDCGVVNNNNLNPSCDGLDTDSERKPPSKASKTVRRSLLREVEGDDAVVPDELAPTAVTEPVRFFFFFFFLKLPSTSLWGV